MFVYDDVTELIFLKVFSNEKYTTPSWWIHEAISTWPQLCSGPRDPQRISDTTESYDADLQHKHTIALESLTE